MLCPHENLPFPAPRAPAESRAEFCAAGHRRGCEEARGTEGDDDGEDAEGDENGKQDADGERVVNQKRGQEKVVLEDADEGDVVLDDVAQKVKEVEDLGHGDERGEPESEVKEEVRQDVGIHELEHGEPNAGTG